MIREKLQSTSCETVINMLFDFKKPLMLRSLTVNLIATSR